jgi:hypothetical protein
MMQRDKQQATTAQDQSRTAREPKSVNLSERLAFSPKEFAAAVGRSSTFAYRTIYKGWVRPISDGVRMMIPRTEIDRFLAKATEYNPKSKPKSEAKPQTEHDETGQPS